MINFSIFYFLNNFADTDFPWLFAFLANDFGYVLILALIYFLVTHEDKKRGARELIMILVVAIAAWGIAHVIKYFYYIPRPFIALSDMHQLLPQEADSAFPSGHATFYSALAMAMYFYHKRIAAILAIGALIIGISRVAAGVHWPVDILAGFVLGPLIAALVYFCIKKVLAKKNENDADPV